jgi:hypothetical protein
MASEHPEESLRAFGTEIGRRRTARGWSQVYVGRRLTEELEKTDPSYQEKSLGESFVYSIENAKKTHLSRSLLNAFFTVFEFSDIEGARWLWMLGLNALADQSDGTMSRPRQLIARIATTLNQNSFVVTLLDLALQNREVDSLTDKEVLKIVADAVYLADPEMMLEYQPGSVIEIQRSTQKDSAV